MEKSYFPGICSKSLHSTFPYIKESLVPYSKEVMMLSRVMDSSDFEVEEENLVDSKWNISAT